MSKDKLHQHNIQSMLSRSVYLQTLLLTNHFSKMFLWLSVAGFSLLISGVCTNKSTQNNFKFFQHDYKAKFEWAEVADYDRGCFEQFNLSVFKFNRSIAVLNFTYRAKLDMGRDVEALFQVYRFASNEYRVFPLRFQMNACLAFDNNIGGIGGFYQCGNFTGCPVLKNIRNHVCNFTPDEIYFPPHVPDGKYKLELQALHGGEEIATIYVYMEVYRPFKG